MNSLWEATQPERKNNTYLFEDMKLYFPASHPSIHPLWYACTNSDNTHVSHPWDRCLKISCAQLSYNSLECVLRNAQCIQRLLLRKQICAERSRMDVWERIVFSVWASICMLVRAYEYIYIWICLCGFVLIYACVFVRTHASCVFVCSCYCVCVPVVVLEWNMDILPLSWIHRNGLGPGLQSSI